LRAEKEQWKVTSEKGKVKARAKRHFYTEAQRRKRSGSKKRRDVFKQRYRGHRGKQTGGAVCAPCCITVVLSGAAY
jgi:hypothetical protein